MQKLFRSLIAIGGLAGLVACGDDVSITPPPPPDLVISGAPVTAIQVGAKVQLSANQAVTWSTSAANVATVDGTGLVTAVAAGVASITATSTADANQKASVTITVSALVNATISLQNITVTGTPGNTVNNNNVSGSIDVNLNVVPGDQVVQRVEVLIDGNVACTQNLTGAQAAVSAEADVEGVDAVIVSCQINTADFNATTGVAKYFNGSHTLTARAIITGGTQTATPSTALIFNNASGFFAAVANTNTKGGPNTAINTTNGTVWRQGDVTLTLTGVTYTQGQSISAATVTFLGCTSTNTSPTNGAFTFAFPATSNDTSCPERDDYTSTGIEVPVVTSVLSGGATGPDSVLNLGAAPVSNPTVPQFPAFRLDNQDPTVPAFAQDSIWVNAATAFTAGSIGNTAAISATTDAGVNSVTATFWATAAGGSLPSGCSTTGLTQITTGNQLAETVTNTVYLVRVLYRDALFNVTCATVGRFGADFVAPTIVSVTGPATNSFFSSAPVTAFSFSVTDNASGFGGEPVLVKLVRLDSANTALCIIGTGTGCTASDTTLSFDATRGLTNNGYYTITYSVVDQAGNATTSTTLTYLLDAVPPTFSGGISLPATILGAATNTFTTSVQDNLDLGAIFGVTAYPTGNIQYPTQNIGTYGSPLEKGPTTVNYAVDNWIRCLNSAGSFGAGATQPTGITLNLTDQAVNVTTATAAFPAANLPACGAVGNLTSPSAILSFTNNDPSYGTGKTQVDRDGSNLVTASSTTVSLSAVAGVTVDNSPDPFTRVDFYYTNAAGNWVKVGSATGVLAQGPSTRTWTYTFVWDPDANVPAGAVAVTAIGIDAQGDAVFATAAAVPTVAVVP